MKYLVTFKNKVSVIKSYRGLFIMDSVLVQINITELAVDNINTTNAETAQATNLARWKYLGVDML